MLIHVVKYQFLPAEKKQFILFVGNFDADESVNVSMSAFINVRIEYFKTLLENY